MSFYTREAIRRAREAAGPSGTGWEPGTEMVLADVPADAATDDATITVWNGERFVAYEKWLATAPLAREEEKLPEGKDVLPADAVSVVGDCGSTRIWLIRDGERWLMFAGSRKAAGRRRDFASPALEHAIRTAEQWYGVPNDGWRVEKTKHEKDIRKATDVPPEDHGAAEKACG